MLLPELQTYREVHAVASWGEGSGAPTKLRLHRAVGGSDDDGFLVFAEGAAEGVGDFAYCGVGFDGGENGGH